MQWERIHLPMQETWVQSLARADPLGWETATHSIIFAWKIPWTEATDGLQSVGSHRVGHDQATERAQCIKMSLKEMMQACGSKRHTTSLRDLAKQ